MCYTLKRHIHIRPVYLRAILFFFFFSQIDGQNELKAIEKEKMVVALAPKEASKCHREDLAKAFYVRTVCLWGLGRWGFQIKRKAAQGPENGFTILSYDTLLSSLLENTPAVERSESPPGRAPTRRGTHMDGHEPWKCFLVARILPAFSACLSLSLSL